MAQTMTVPALPAVPNALKGLLLVVLATLAFATGDALTKHLAADNPVLLVIGVRFLISLALLLVFLMPKHGKDLWRVQRTGMVLLRGLCLAGASLAMGKALQVMPVGEAIAIAYLCPFAVMLLAVPLLGERVSLVGWFGAVFGFAGVLLIMRPGNGLDSLGVALALVNAALVTAYTLLTRMLAPTETTVAMLFHATLIGTVIFFPMALSSLGSISPSASDLGLMLLLGVLFTLGHFLFTAAYRGAPASLLAPVNYMHIAWGGVLGWLIFDHIPDRWSLAGMAMIVTAGVAIAVYTHFDKRRRALLAETDSMR